MKFATKVKQNLCNLIRHISDNRKDYVRNPHTDFVRNRKLSLEKITLFLLSMSGQSTQDELLNFYDHKEYTPTVSALSQQRDKISPAYFPEILKRFNSQYSGKIKYKDYRLLACDGSDINIFRNPDDPTSYYRNSSNDKGFNELHIDALYDLCNRTYQMLNITGRHEQNEQRALINFMKTYTAQDKCIFIADRNYESWNILANAQHSNLKYVIRAKDITSNGILHTFNINQAVGEIDIELSINLTRLKRCIDKKQPERFRTMATNVTFDFISPGEEGVFPLGFRLVRIRIGEDKYESLLTNLCVSEFSMQEIKELYAMRWGIETSFRELKHALSLNKLHSKKVDHIHQEIFAKVIMYNFCSLITMHVAQKRKKRKHIHQINFSRAIKECRHFLMCAPDDPPDVEAIIMQYMLPVRPGRSNPRKVKIREKASFLYR